MNDEQYLNYMSELYRAFTDNFTIRCAHLEETHPLRELATRLSALSPSRPEFYVECTELIDRLFSTFPDFAPTVPRQLLWFLGGNALHFMADEEIAQFQQLDDERAAAAARGELFNPREARAKLLNLQ